MLILKHQIKQNSKTNKAMYTPDKYTIEKIATLEDKIAQLTAELEYNKAWLFLDGLAHTQETTLVDYLIPVYGSEKVMAFDKKAFRRGIATTDYFTATKIVKRAISDYKSKTDTKKNPSWASKALKAAKIVDNF